MKKFIRITETRYGRTIEMRVEDDGPRRLEDKKYKKEETLLQRTLMTLSLFGWGFLGVAVGNLIFIHS